MSIVEPPIRASNSTPLSDAGESSSELVASLLQQHQSGASINSGISSVQIMSKAEHDAIFGRAASTSGCRSPIVAHEDDSYGYHLEHQHSSRSFQPNVQSSSNFQVVANHNVQVSTTTAAASSSIPSTSRMVASSGRSPRSIPMQVPSHIPPNVNTQAVARSYPPSAHSSAIAPTALMIMRRRRSSSNSSGNKKVVDELGMSNSGRSGTGSGSSQEKLSSYNNKSRSSSSANKSNPKGFPKTKASSSVPGNNGPHDMNGALNYNAAIQQQQQQHQQAYGAMPQPQVHQLQTAMRYNSSLHSTLGGYPMGIPTQLTHPSVTHELIARDRARWEADYYGNYGTGGGMSDYGCDYGSDNVGGYYGATPSFRGMSQGMHMQMQHQDQQGQGGMGDLKMEQFHQPQVQQQSFQLPPQQLKPQVQQQRSQWPPQQQLHQPNQEGGLALTSNVAYGVSQAPAPMPAEINMPPNTRRVYQEHDYKNDRVWQEDDHTSRPERRITEKTSNLEDKLAPLPSVPQLRARENGVPAQAQQGSQASQQQPVSHLQSQPQQPPIPQGHRLSIDEYDIMSYHSGMTPYYQGPLPPSTPVRSERNQDPRVRQMSDMSSVAGSGSVNGHPLPVVYPYPAVHPHYGLIYPPTPGSIGSMPPQSIYQQQHDPRVWVDPHLQHMPQPSAAHVVNAPPEENKTQSKSVSSVTDVPAAPTPSSRAPPKHSNDLVPPVSNSSTKPSSNKKSVSFSHLQFRTYETILGDNPSCSGGPSLGLGWRYDPKHYSATVDEYEAQQQELYGGPDGQPYECRPEDLVLHRFEREAILLNTGYTRQDLADSVRALNKVKNKRRQTVHNLPVAFVEERAEVVKRTWRRWILKKERTRHLYEDWKKKSVEVRQDQ